MGLQGINLFRRRRGSAKKLKGGEASRSSSPFVEAAKNQQSGISSSSIFSSRGSSSVGVSSVLSRIGTFGRAGYLYASGTESIVVGKGSTCSVECFNKNGQSYAVKRASMEDPSEHYNDVLRAMLEKEYAILSELMCPNIVCVMELQSVNNLFVMEYIPFSLYKIMKMELKPSLEERRCFMVQLIQGVAYLREHDVVHRDLKLENIMLSPDCHGIKIVDFGNAVKLEPGKNICHGLGGSEPLMAPEVFSLLSYKGFAVDIWSLGIIMFLLFNDTGKLKFPWKVAKLTDETFKEFVESGELSMCKYGDLCKKLLVLDPGERATAAQLMKEPFVDYQCNRYNHDRTRRLCHKIWGERHEIK
ncbi:uncharacterized protein Ecym_6301 [Eremothecium cymbalariae DBVPG|uniref:Protein kinase domain-containing protein n=1 Tax=Eremothecium cymbalariae (strain CBS 270.75 / DBVPG 7215 / KCTC 17166 / NRRL Y-17582) TaxID=931890 RepID=G8JUA1_ERECY|nr:hypothetical protein Ecym_6301 [Eremothecium cymbalariae DBVPG\